MLIKQGACAIKTRKWALMATAPAASAISVPFCTYRQRYISTLIWAALHRSLRKYFHSLPLRLFWFRLTWGQSWSSRNRAARDRRRAVKLRWHHFIKMSLSRGPHYPSFFLNPPLSRIEETLINHKWASRGFDGGSWRGAESWRFSMMARWFISLWLMLWRTKRWRW